MSCRTKRCQGEAKRGLYCYRCKYQREKQRDWYKWSFGVHRRNARRRGLAWELTFEEFKKFAIEVNLRIKAGRSKRSLHIDRREAHKGYTLDNIQPLTNRKNVQKMHIEKALAYDWQTKEARVVTFKQTEEPGAPF